MSTIRIGGVWFRIHPHDHEPIHTHGYYAETVVIVEFRPNGTVALADRQDSLTPRDAKRSDVRKILNAADEGFDTIMAAWERMKS
jgi:hypothetical protein